MPLKAFESMAYERQLFADLDARGQRMRGLRERASQEQADRVVGMTREYPWLEPGVVMALAEAGVEPDSEIARRAAEVSADRQVEQGEWIPDGAQVAPTQADRERAASQSFIAEAFDEVKAGSRGIFAGLQSGYDEMQNLLQAGVIAEQQEDVSFGEALGDTAPSIARQHLQNRREGVETDLGEGWFPGGEAMERRRGQVADFAHRYAPDIAETHEDPAEAFLTFGRLAAREVTEPGSRAFQVTSGTVDLATAIFADPANIALGGAGKAAHARKLMPGVGEKGLRAAFPTATKLADRAGLTQGRRPMAVEDEAVDWLTRQRDGRRVVDWLTNETSVDRIWKGSNRKFDKDLSVELADARTQGEVRDILTREITEGRMREKPGPYGLTSPLSRAAGGAAFGDMGRVAGIRLAAKARSDQVRFLQWTPHQAIDVEDPNTGLVHLDRFMSNAKLPREVIERRNEEFARASNIEEMRTVVHESLSDVFEQVVGKGGTRAEAERLTRSFHGAFEQQFREYNIDAHTGHTRLTAGTRVDDHGNPIPTATILTEYLQRNIPLPDFREVRRATSNPIFRSVLRDRDKLPNHVARWGIDAASAFMSNVWQPAKLFRVAWPVRVMMEELGGRLPASGMHGLNHPMQWMAYAFGGRGSRLIGGDEADLAVRMAKGDYSFPQEIEDAVSAMNVRSAGWRNKLPTGVATGDYGKVARGDKNFIRAWARDELAQLYDEPVMRRMAGGLSEEDFATIPEGVRRGLDRESSDAVTEWFWSGGGKEYRERLATAGEAKDELLDSREFAERYLRENYWERIVEKTGGDHELMDLIATGQLPDGTDMRGVLLDGKKGNEAEAAFHALLGRKLEELGDDAPKYVKAARDITGDAQKRGARLDHAVDTIFENLFSAPNNKLVRLPAWKQHYWQRAEELIPFMDRATRRRVIADAKEAGLSRGEVRRMVDRAKAAEPGVIDDPEAVDMIARKFALDETKRLLYDVTERGQISDILRVTNPFFEAWREIGMTWTRLLAERPQNVRRLQQGVEGARGAGVFYTDPVTEEEMFAYPGGELLANLGLRAAAAFGERDPRAALEDPMPEGAEVGLTGTVSGINLVGNVMPGFGPAVTLPANQIIGPGGADDDPRWDGVREFLMPFGAPEGEHILSQAAHDTLPAYAQKLITFTREDPESDRMLANTILDTMKVLAASGDYTANPQGMATEDEQNRLLSDARAIGYRLHTIRALSQTTLPTGPQLDFRIDDPGGGGTLAVKELAQWLRDREEEVGYDQAFSDFVDRFGWDLTITTQGRSRSIGERALTEGGWQWERENPHVVDALPFTVGYFAPDPEGEFDIRAWQAQFGEVRDPVTPEQFAHLRNNMLGWQAYEHARSQVGDRTDPEATSWLRGVREDIRDEFPGFNSTIPGLRERPDVEEQVRELERALTVPEVMATPAGQGLAAYMQARQQVAEAAQQRHDVTGWDRAKSTGYLRDWLRQVGQQVSQQHPEFAPMYERVLERELDRFNRDESTRGEVQ